MKASTVNGLENQMDIHDLPEVRNVYEQSTSKLMLHVLSDGKRNTNNTK